MAVEPGMQPSLSRFIARLGLYFEEFGLPRIAGRLLGLLLISDGPLSLDEIATTLHVSRASVSTNARMLTKTRLIERAGFPGDRRDYYTFTASNWEALIETDVQGAATLREFAAEALEGIGGAESEAGPRLQAAIEFFDFYAAELQATLGRWREQLRARPTGDRESAAARPLAAKPARRR